MGSIGGMLGTAGGAAGTGFKTPQQTQIQQGTNVGQVQQANTGTNAALGGQAGLLAALQSQGGLGAQTQALGQQQALSQQLGQAGGIAAQTGALGGLGGVASQQAGTLAALQGLANGTGPNPAQAMLSQQTGANVANQAALMAGQRGAGANVGLMARQAAQQGANTQQQAAGQAATMQAQQQLGALGQQAGLEQAMAGTQGQIAGIGQGLTAAQQAALGQQAGQAGQIAGQQIAETGALTQAQMAQQGQLMGALGQQNTANVAQQGNVNAANAGLATAAMGNQGKLLGGALSGAALAAGLPGAAAAARGGKVKKMADGGTTDTTQAANDYTSPWNPQPAAPQIDAPMAEAPNAPKSSFGKFLTGFGSAMNPQGGAEDPLQKGMSTFIQAMGSRVKNAYNAPSDDSSETTDMARGGKVKAMVSEKEVVVPPEDANSPRKSAQYVKKELATGGGIKARTPDEKAVKKGNSYDNDKIPADLEEGSIVIPRSVMQSKDPVRGSADFVSKVLAKRGKK
jgi:hypothetical protein